MILRRSRSTDLRFVLGSALALLLLLGAKPAAQTRNSSSSATLATAPAPAVDAIKQRNQELDATRLRQRDAADRQVQLKLEIDALGDDRRALNQQLIESAASVREMEAKIEAIRARLQSLDERQQAVRKTLNERRDVIIELLAALQRVGRQPPPALLVRPQDALQALRTAMALGAVVPNMRAEANTLAGDLAELSRVRMDILAERGELSQNLDKLAREQLRLNMLIDDRQKKQAAAERALEAEQQRAIELAQQADNLKDLIAKLEQGLDSASLASGASTRATEEDAARPGIAVLGNPGRLAPAIAFADARGQLHLPVNGVPIAGFGDPNGTGGTQKGLSIATRAGAVITSPCDGWVVYSGPFRSYGQVLILNAGGGYHVLLAGMERISVDLGQFVLTGEPVALMGEGAQLPPAVGVRSKQPVLYVEFRKGGTPIDPSPWWATNESKKVRG